MKEKLIVTTILIATLGLFLIFTLRVIKKSPKVCFENTCFTVEVVDTVGKRQRGLMGRESLSEEQGMFFVFEEEGKHSFWMKNTLIPLDIIWLSQDFVVVDVLTAEPCRSENCSSYSPSGSAQYVLEINAGLAKKYSIGQGLKASVSWK